MDPVMSQPQEEKENNLLYNATVGSPAMTSAEVCSSKKNKSRKRWERRQNATESNVNIPGFPKDTFSTETSTVSLNVPPKHPVQYTMDPVMGQSLAENEGKDKDMVENAADGSPAMTSEEVSLRNKNKRRKRQERRHGAIESNCNLSCVPKDTFSNETSTVALAMSPQHPAQYYVAPVTRQSQEENKGKEKIVLVNAADGSSAMISEEVNLRQKNKRRKRQENRHNAIESNGNLSGILKDTFSTDTCTAALAVLPQYQPQYPMDHVTRQSQAENEGKEKNVLEIATDQSAAMINEEVSVRKKNKRRKRQEKRLNAIESNDNLSGVLKDTFSTETSTAALAVPPQNQPHYSVDPVTRQSQAENEGKEKNVLENAADGSSAMISEEVSLIKKNRRRKRQEKRHNAIESSGNLSGVPKDTFSTETSTTALSVPPHQPQYSVDPLMRQSLVENEGKEKSVLETVTDGSAAMTSAEVSLRKKNKRRKRQEKRHNAIESSGNLSCAPKDIFSAETSTAALAMPPQHPVMSQSLPENEGKDNSMLENAADGFPAMTSEEVRSRKKNKGRKRQESRHNAIESKGDLSVVPKDTFSTETSRPSLDMTSQHPIQYSMDPVMRHCQGENEGEEQNMSEKAADESQAMVNAEVNSRKKNKKRKRRKTRLNDIESNINPSGAPPETCTPTFDMPPQDPAQYLMDPVKRQCQEENELKELNMLEKPTNGSSAMTSAELNLRKKERRKRQKTRHNAVQSNVTLSGVPDNTISTATSTPALDMLSQQPAQCLSMDPVMRHSLEENEGKERNMLDKAAESNNAEHNLEMKNSNPGSVVANADHFEKEFMSEVVKLNAVQVDSVQMLEMEVSKDQVSLNPGAAFEEMKLMTENSCEQRFVTVVDFPEVQHEEKNGRKLDFQVTRHDMSSAGDIADLSLVSKQDGGSTTSPFSPGRTITSHSKKKLLVLDLNGLLADFAPSVREGYKPDIKISDKKVFKRPFCDDFLRFCFDRFHVGIWSSRTGKNVATAIKFLVGEFASKLLFRWNNYHCTRTKFRTIDKKKLIFLKELRKLWEKLKPGLPWEKGEFNESNTLLLDDSPYKALRNPMYTGIFPYPYQYFDTNDTSLGREGDLRVYLEGLAMADNVQEYVASHPFGQPEITESNPHWDLYKRVRGAAKCDAATSKP